MVRFASIATFALLLSTAASQISRQECVDQGGVVVGDSGDGAIFAPDYICAVGRLPPTDTVVAGPDEPIAIEGEVCCDGSGTGLVGGNGSLPPTIDDGTVDAGNFTRPEMSVAECEAQGGILTLDIGDGAIHREDYLCELTGLPPIGTVIALSGESMPREGQVCCPSSGGTEGSTGEPLPVATPAERDEYTRQECTDMGALIVGDIGDGAIFLDDYICDSNGLPPIANIVQDSEPFAIEGEVCCGEGIPVTEVEREVVSRQECEERGGEIVGDIGDGSTQLADYRCDSNGEAPIANVVPLEGEPIADEGEVCCGPAANTTVVDDSEGDSGIFDGNSTFPEESVDRDEVSGLECEEQGGEIVGDIGDGATQLADYMCESNGEAPIANVVAGEGEPIAFEGEVCCGPPANTTAADGDGGNGSDELDENGTPPDGEATGLNETGAAAPEDGAFSVSFHCVLGLAIVPLMVNIF